MNFPLDIIQNTPTPFYLYDLKLLHNTLDACISESNKYGYHVHYALKANTNNEILQIIKEKGFGADCVSGNEIKKAIEIGFESKNIAFAGVGKSDAEINIALDHNIFSFNCESLPELEVINEIAKGRSQVADVALRINPNVNAKTHHYITTGLEENKFGINMWEMDDLLEKLPNLSNINLIGIHFHIGSQITDLSVFRGLCIRVNEIQEYFVKKHVQLKHINVGGGLGVDYENPDTNAISDFATFFKIFNEHLKLLPDQQLHFELGRCLVAQSGSLITKVLYVKNGVKTNFAIVDAGMTELIRPALYQSYHHIENISNPSEANEKYDVVGPICESSDCFGKAVKMPHTQRGNYIAIRTTGAYGEVMASAYNLRDRVKAVYIN